MRREKKEAVSYPHVSSPLCIYGTYAHVLVLAVSVCRALGDFKWIFQRPTIPVACVRGSFPGILAMTPALPRRTAWTPAAPAAPQTHLQRSKSMETSHMEELYNRTE